MIARLFTCALLATALAGPTLGAGTPAQAGQLSGDWNAYVSEKHPDRFQFSMRQGTSHNSGSQFARADFVGLTNTQVESATRVEVQFELRREAGRFEFEGTFKNGHGAGLYTFTPNRDFARQLRSIGMKFPAGDLDDDEQLYYLAIFDVSTEFIRSMRKIGYDESLDMYQQFRIFGVDPEYVRAMAAIGYKDLQASKLVETKIHGATPEYIREMRAAGEDLSLDEYIQSRIFRVTPEFAAEMSRAGYANVDRDMLVQFRIHGVTPEFVAELRTLGYSRLPASKLVEMRIHGVTPEFIRRVEKAGYRKVPIDKLVQMRIFDIEPEMVRALDEGQKL